jgi:NAD(P)H dehydrogenase (quinone)
MRVLVVYCHPCPESFTAAVRDTVLATLAAAGHDVDLVDLYADGFDPTMGADERRTYHEVPRNLDPVRAYAGRLERAEALIFVYPTWWFGLPAMLKGWIDRVWLQGFAFGTTGPGGPRLRYGDGGLAGKTALPIVTAGDRPASFAPRGVNGDVDELLFPVLHGTFWYCGMETLQPVFVPGVGYPGWDGMDRAVHEIRTAVDALTDPDRRERVRYRALSSGDYGRDRLMREDLLTGETGVRIHRA